VQFDHELQPALVAFTADEILIFTKWSCITTTVSRLLVKQLQVAFHGRNKECTTRSLIISLEFAVPTCPFYFTDTELTWSRSSFRADM